MFSLLRPIALLAVVAAPILAEESSPQVVEEITELRNQFGEIVVGDRADFAEALKNVAEQAGHAEAYDGLTPGAQDYGNSSPRHNNRLQQPKHQQPQVHAPGWNGADPGGRRVDRFATPPLWAVPGRPSAWTGGPPANRPGPPSERPTKVLLRESAFQLDRLAHELEMSELCDEADSLRKSAEKLRKSARRSDTSQQVTRKEEAETGRDRQKMKRELQKVTEMQRRMKEAKREIEREKRGFAERVQAAERQTREKIKELRKRTERKSKQSSAPDEQNPDKADRYGASPPLGVHGGPTEPPKPHDE